MIVELVVVNELPESFVLQVFCYKAPSLIIQNETVAKLLSLSICRS